MVTITFDSLGYAKKLEAAGFTREQAEVQADAFRIQTEAQAEAIQKALSKYDEASRKELATKGDVQDVRLEIQDVRLEIQDVRLEIQDVRNELKAEIADTKHEILKWMMGMLVAQTALIAAVIAFIK